MGSVGDCYDNAMCESFFATLECEMLARHSFPTRAEAKRAMFHFIEGWYNAHRRHSALGFVSPTTSRRTGACSVRSALHRLRPGVLQPFPPLRESLSRDYSASPGSRFFRG
jgi:hypothetical protein